MLGAWAAVMAMTSSRVQSGVSVAAGGKREWFLGVQFAEETGMRGDGR